MEGYPPTSQALETHWRLSNRDRWILERFRWRNALDIARLGGGRALRNNRLYVAGIRVDQYSQGIVNWSWLLAIFRDGWRGVCHAYPSFSPMDKAGMIPFNVVSLGLVIPQFVADFGSTFP